MKHHWSVGVISLVAACAAPLPEAERTLSEEELWGPEVAEAPEVEPQETVAIPPPADPEPRELPPPDVPFVEEDVHGLAPLEPRAAIEAWFQSQLADPGAAEFVLEEPRRGYFGDGDPRFGWVVATWVQEAGTSPQLYHCWFRGARLIAVLDPTRMPSFVEVASR